jgi:LacI family transcriptional regulator
VGYYNLILKEYKLFHMNFKLTSQKQNLFYEGNDMATIKEIANKTGVSISAVSRVLNHDATISVSAETKMRIFQIAQELEYKTVRERKTIEAELTRLTFGLVDWYSDVELLDDPYYLYLMTAIEKECALANIDIYKMNKVNGRFNAFKFNNIDGIIAIGKFSDEEISDLTAYTNKIVFLDSSPQEKLFDSVTINIKLGVIEALEHLLELGHTEIGFLGAHGIGDHKEPIVEHRTQIFIDFMKNHNLYNADYIYLGNKISYSGGYNLMNEAYKAGNMPSAFFIANDTMATGAIRALYEAKLHVPNDISIIGFNDNATSKYLVPPLTTVRVHLGFMAATTVELLMERINKERIVSKKVLVPCELVIRKSCKRRK